MTRSFVTTPALAAALAVSVMAQTPAAPNPASLTIDFTAYDAAGGPIFDLKPEEINVRIGSRERAVRTLELVRPAGAGGGGGLPLPFASSIAPRLTSRSILFVFDDESVRPGREDAFRPAIAQLLAALTPSDRVAVATVPLGGIRLDFTTNHARARDLLNGIGGKAPRTETSTDFACRGKRTLAALAALLDSVAGGESAVTVVHVGSSLSGLTDDPGSARHIGAGMCQILPEQFEHVGIAAARARATFVVLQPEDPMIAPGTVGAADLAGRRVADLGLGLEDLAGVTGGELIRLQGAAGGTTERILRESTNYYLATVDTDPSDRGVARLEVKTTRPGATVRARPRVALTLANRDAGRKTAVSPRDMLRRSRGYAEFAMRATAYVGSNRGDSRLRVIALAEAEPTAQLNAAAVGIFDAGGKMVAQWTARPEELSGAVVMAALPVPPGTYRMRVAATDAAGRAATVDYDLDATLESVGSIRMSGLVLGVSREGSFFPRMLFTSEPTAIAQLELIDVPPGIRPTAQIEMARSLNGPAVISVPGAVTLGQDPAGATVRGVIPLGAFPAGDYVIRVIVSIPGGPSGRVVRTLRKVG